MAHGAVERWLGVTPNPLARGPGCFRVHHSRLQIGTVFVYFAPLLASDCAVGHKKSATIEPASQGGAIRQLWRLPRHQGEDLLGDVFCKRGVTVRLPKRDRINQVHVEANELSERPLVGMLDVLPDQFSGRGHDGEWCPFAPETELK